MRSKCFKYKYIFDPDLYFIISIFFLMNKKVEYTFIHLNLQYIL